MSASRSDEWRDHLTADPGDDASETIRVADRPRPPIPKLELPRIDIAEGDASGPSADEAACDLHIVREIGRGGMGRVDLARQRSLDREVAVKRVASGSRTAREALLSEARILGQLDHQNIVPVYALGLDAEGAPALVMKRLSAVPWGALLRDPSHPAWPPGVADQFVVGTIILAAIFAVWKVPEGGPKNSIIAIAAAAAGLIVLVIVRVFRDEVLSTSLNERLWRTILAAMGAMSLNHVTGEIAGIAPERLLPADILIGTALFFVVGWTFHSRLAFFSPPIARASPEKP